MKFDITDRDLEAIFARPGPGCVVSAGEHMAMAGKTYFPYVRRVPTR
jgi:hypothetical protein